MNNLYLANRAERLPHILEVFGLEWVPGDDVHNANEVNRAFVGPEHGQLNVPCSDEQADAVRPDLVALGFAEPSVPTKTIFDNTYLHPAVTPANVRRLQLYKELKAKGYLLGDLHIMSGQRPLEGRDVEPIELINGINPDVVEHHWFEQFFAIGPWQNNWHITDFHVWVGLVLAMLPDAQWLNVTRSSDEKPVAGVPARVLLDVRFRLPDSTTVYVHNFAAVERWDALNNPAPPRPTTESCVKELVSRYPRLLSTGETALDINGNPHAGRMETVIGNTLAAMDRHPRRELAATALPPDNPRFVRNALHELGSIEFHAHLEG